MTPTDTDVRDHDGTDPELERRIRTALTAVASTIDIEHTVDDGGASSVRPGSTPSGRRTRRMLAGAAAVLIAAVATAGVWQVTRPADDAQVAWPDGERSSGTIDDPLEIDLDPWRVGAPPWPPDPPGPYLAIDIASFPDGWTVDNINGTHLLSDAWTWSALLITPDGLLVSASVSRDDRGPSTNVASSPEEAVEMRGTTAAANQPLSWRARDVHVSITALADTDDPDLVARLENDLVGLAEAIDLQEIEQLPGWNPLDQDWGVDHGEVALAGRIDASAWELRTTPNSTSVLVDGRPIAWGTAQPRGTKIQLGGAGDGVMAFGLGPDRIDRVVVHLSDRTTVTVPAVPDDELVLWAVPIPPGLDVTAIAFVDESGDTFHRLDLPPIPMPSVGAITRAEAHYGHPDGVPLLSDPRSITCTLRDGTDGPVTFEAAPDTVTTAQFRELTIDVDRRRAGMTVRIADLDGRPVSIATGADDRVTIRMVDPLVWVDCEP